MAMSVLLTMSLSFQPQVVSSRLKAGTPLIFPGVQEVSSFLAFRRFLPNPNDSQENSTFMSVCKACFISVIRSYCAAAYPTSFIEFKPLAAL
jgi:hypothetical protein